MKARVLLVLLGVLILGGIIAGVLLRNDNQQSGLPAAEQSTEVAEIAEPIEAAPAIEPETAALVSEVQPAPAAQVTIAGEVAPVDDAEGRVVVHGRVTDNAGNALAHVAINLSMMTLGVGEADDMLGRRDFGTIQTDDDGNYRHTFSIPSGLMGLFALTAERDGFALASESRPSFDPGEGPPTGPTRLDWAWSPVMVPGSTLAGSVVDGDGNPVAGAWLVAIPLVSPGVAWIPIDVDDSRTLTTESDDAGAFAFAGAFAAPYYVGATRLRGVIEAELEVDAPADDLELVLYAPSARVSGSVINERTGEAVPNVAVRLSGGPNFMSMAMENRQPTNKEFASIMAHQRARQIPGSADPTISGPDGRFTLSGMAAGTYTFAVEDKVWMLSREQQPVTVYEGQHLEATEVLVHDGHVVKGGVYLAGTGTPVPGIRVVLLQAWGGPTTEITADTPGAITDAQGRYTIKTRVQHGMLGIDSSEYQIVSQSQHGWDQSRFVNFLDPNRPEEVDLEVALSLTISGVVRTADGEPVGEGTVTLVHQGGNPMGSPSEKATVASDGTFRVAVPPNTSLALQYDGPGYPVAHSDLIHVIDDPIDGIEIVVHPASTLAGRVVGPDEAPVAGATVNSYYLVAIGNRSWRHHSTGTATTAGDGSFTLTNLPPRTILLEATASGYGKSRRAEYALEPGSHRNDARIVMSQVGRLAGRVVDENDQPLANIQVNAYANASNFSDHHNTNTKEDGTFGFDAVHGMNYQIHAWDTRGQRQIPNRTASAPDENIILKASAATEAPAQPPSPADRVLFLGTVRDAETKQPLEVFTVEHDRSQGWYSSDPIQRDRTVAGLFRLEVTGGQIPPLIVNSPGYAPARSALISVTDAMRESGVHQYTYEMVKGATITGRTMSEETGEPLAGVRVELKGVAPQPWQEPERPIAVVTTGADGRFSVSGAASGNNIIRFRPSSPYMHDRREIAVAESTGTIDAGDIPIGKGRRITVEVFDTATQSPVPGVALAGTMMASLTAEAGSGNKTGRDGRLTFPAVSYESNTIALDGTLVMATIPSAREDTTLRLPVGKATVEVTFLFEGRPVVPNYSNMSRAASTDDAMSKRQMDGIPDMPLYIQTGAGFRDGKLVITDLAAGTWHVSGGLQTNAANNPYRHVSEQVQLVDHEVVQVELTFDEGKVTGMVVDREGLPVAGARVTGTNDLSVTLIISATTDANGRFDMTGSQPGPHTIRAEKEGVGVAIEKDVQLGPGRSVDLLLKLEPPSGGTLVSRAYRLADGTPIPLAWCKMYDAQGAEHRHGQLRREDGTMRIEGIPEGRYRVEVSYWSHSINTRQVDIIAGQEVEIEDVLYGAGAIRATIRTASGAPITGRAWTLTPDVSNTIEQPRQGTTDNNSQAVIRGLYPGNYRLDIVKANGQTHSETFAIVEGEVTERQVSIAE